MGWCRYICTSSPVISTTINFPLIEQKERIMKVYLLETGVLLDRSDKDYGNCSQIYGKQHGFYDE